MKKISIVLLLNTLFMISCTTENENRGYHFDSIESTHPVRKKFEVLPTEVMLGAPYQIKIVDSLALIADEFDKKTLLILNLKNNAEVTRFLAIGRGPGEVLSPIAIEYQNDSLYILDRRTLDGRLLVYSLSDIINKSGINFSTHYFPRARTITKIPNGFLTSGPFKDNFIHEYDAGYDSISVNSNFYPEFLSQSDREFDRYLIGQGDIVFNKGKLLVTHALLGEIRFYRKGKDTYDLLKYYTFGNSETIKHRVANNNYKILPNDIMHFDYGSSCASKNAFYVLYDGKHMKREAPRDYSILMKFDIDGNFVRSYRLNASIACFTVTDNDTVYAITLTPENDFALSRIQL